MPREYWLKARTSKEFLARFNLLASAERRSHPDMLRVVVEDWIAAKEQEDAAINERPPKYKPKPGGGGEPSHGVDEKLRSRRH